MMVTVWSWMDVSWGISGFGGGISGVSRGSRWCGGGVVGVSGGLAGVLQEWWKWSSTVYFTA